MVVGLDLEGEVDLRERRSYEYARVWRWLIAGLADWLMAIVLGLLGAALYAVPTTFVVWGDYSFNANFFSGMMYFGAPVGYGVMVVWHVVIAFRVASKGDTMGHRLFGMRIVRADGGQISRRHALVRQILGSPVMSVYLLPTVCFRVVNDLFGFTLARTPAEMLIWVMLGLLNLVWLNLFFMVFDRRWRGWHDVVVGTVVVRGR